MNNERQTLMEQEAREAPKIIAKQLLVNEAMILDLCAQLKKNPPPFVLTIGRGSSDHACTFAKYLFETRLGLVTASGAPSVVTHYHAKLKMANALAVGISQSGKSPDICKMMEMAKGAEAVTLALVNDSDSPLAKISKYVLPLCAGNEQAVAATKSYIASLTALVQFVANLAEDKNLKAAVNNLPITMDQVLTDTDWDGALLEFKDVDHALVIARGFGFPIAQEVALKFKETCGIQAEAFSSAEVLHGPFALIKKNHPFLLFMQNDATLNSNLELARKIRALSGKVILVIPKKLLAQKILDEIADFVIFLPESSDPILDPIHTVLACYLMIAKLSVLRGFNPDAPLNLRKVTETV